MCSISDQFADVFERCGWIGNGVAEHVEESGSEKGVELVEGLTALCPQSVCRIQNPPNPLPLGEGREGDFHNVHEIAIECGDACAPRELLKTHPGQQPVDPSGIITVKVLNSECGIERPKVSLHIMTLA
jgi:hypothetical protein